MKSIYQTVNSLKESSSRNDKIKLLRESKTSTDYEFFKLLCDKVMNPLLVYNIRKLPKYEWKGGSITLVDILSTNGILSKLYSREITGNLAKEELKYTLENTVDKETSLLLECCINKTFDCGADVKTFNKAFGEVIVREHQYQLCESATEQLIDKLLEDECVSQLKLDAMRVEVNNGDSISFITRGSNSFGTGNIELDSKLKEPFDKAIQIYTEFGYIVSKIYLDGELVFLENGKHLPRAKSNGIATKCIKGTKEFIKDDEIEIIIWDIISEEEKQGKLKIPYKTKLAILERIKLNSPYSLVESTPIKTKEQAIQIAIEYVKLGLEGSVVKGLNSYWENKRVNHQLKLKAARQSEVRIKGILISDENKYHGLVGSLTCETDDGLVKVNVSGMSDHQRTEFLDKSFIGKVITVEFNEAIQDKDGHYSLFLPRLIEIRVDKDTTDTLQSVLTAPFIVCK